jgi:hypothetical protein
MSYVDKWGTRYPGKLVDYVEGKDIINLTPSIKNTSDDIIRGAATTDEAILKIHEFMKKSIPVGHVPLTIDIPIRRASDQITLVQKNPRAKNLCHQKTIMEVALLRAQGIPARVATTLCGAHSSRMRYSPLLKFLVKTAPGLTSLPVFPHTYPEVYSYKDGKGEFRRKDAWIPERACKDFEGTCFEEEKQSWMKNRDVPDVQQFLNCKKLQSSADFPAWLSTWVNAGVIARESTHFLDLIDPSSRPG